MFSQKSLSLELDPEMRLENGLSKTNTFIVWMIIISVLIGVLETELLLFDRFQSLFLLANGALFLIFFVEYVARIYAAPVNPRHSSSLRYAFTLASLFDLIVLISFALPFFGLEAALLRVFRAARLLRLAKLGRYSIAMQTIYKAVAQRRFELGLSVLIALALMLLSSTVLYFAERTTQPEDFGSIPRAMWWSVATLTTVGYGDIVPMTFLGRIAAAFTALTGVGLIALPTGILASAFADAIKNIRTEKD